MVEQHVKAALQRYGKQIACAKHSWSQAYLDAEQERIVSSSRSGWITKPGGLPFTVEAGEEKLPATVGDLKLQVRVDRIDAVAAAA
jgi:hypothetical protein